MERIHKNLPDTGLRVLQSDDEHSLTVHLVSHQQLGVVTRAWTGGRWTYLTGDGRMFGTAAEAASHVAALWAEERLNGD